MNKLHLLPLAFALALSGCTWLNPEYQRPSMELPTAWPAAAPETMAADRAGERWWSLYRDPVLDQLVDEALANNADLQLALARVQEARALAGSADADRYPVVSDKFTRSRTKPSHQGPFPIPAAVPRIQITYRPTLD